jgi:hypothetical protein
MAPTERTDGGLFSGGIFIFPTRCPSSPRSNTQDQVIGHLYWRKRKGLLGVDSERDVGIDFLAIQAYIRKRR